ncbi:16028_t:CDS:1, partial [Acaulospora morrowiae]
MEKDTYHLIIRMELRKYKDHLKEGIVIQEEIQATTIGIQDIVKPTTIIGMEIVITLVIRKDIDNTR